MPAASLPAQVLVDGRPYHPRKPPYADIYECGPWGDSVIIVWRSHDLEVADRLAMEVAIGHLGPVDLPEPKRHWMRIVPWDCSGYGDFSAIDAEPGKGTPCVEYAWS